jgi:hypothetical protein
MKEYRRIWSITPLISNLDTTGKWVLNFTPSGENPGTEFQENLAVLFSRVKQSKKKGWLTLENGSDTSVTN